MFVHELLPLFVFHKGIKVKKHNFFFLPFSFPSIQIHLRKIIFSSISPYTTKLSVNDFVMRKLSSQKYTLIEKKNWSFKSHTQNLKFTRNITADLNKKDVNLHFLLSQTP
jgi:hypothetical protein